MQIFEWPREWYRFTSTTFPLRSRSQTSPRPWAGGNNIYGPHAQFWNPSFAATVGDKFLWQTVSAFISRLGGQSGLLRIGHSIRLKPQYTREVKVTRERFSDGSTFTDGTEFVSGPLPPACHVLRPAPRGAFNVQLGGLPASLPRVLRRGDLIEFRPNGIADGVPRLHEVMVDGNTNADGQTGVEIRPALRAGLAFGDTAVLEFPTSVFHMVSDDEGDVEMSAPSLGTFGFKLIEALDNA